MSMLLLMCVVIGGSIPALLSNGRGSFVTDAKIYPSKFSKAPAFELAGQGRWYMGKQTCAKRNMRLVRIGDQAKSDDVHDFIQTLNKKDTPGPFWTLASRLYDGQTWAFDTDDKVKFFHWARGDPHDNAGDCVAVDYDGLWHNRDCKKEYNILCESY